MKKISKTKLGLVDATMIISGSMIGSGIFIVAASMARELLTAGMLLLAWGVTALFTWSGALSYGELSALMPHAGGQYTYLKTIYNRLIGFLYGWTLFTVIQTGTIAAVAVAFAKFSAVFFPQLNGSWYFLSYQKLLAILVIIAITLFNFNSIKKSAFLQNIFTILKVAALAILVMVGIWGISTMKIDHSIDWRLFPNGFNLNQIMLFLGALVGSLFSADAWNNVAFAGSEFDKPEKTLPRSLILGTGLVLVMYFLINYMYIEVLSFDEIKNANQDRVGTAFLEKLLGNNGLKAMACLIMVSTFGCLNGVILSSARVFHSMAVDKLFFLNAAKLNKHNSPANALIYQGIWASLLVLSGSYTDLLDYVVFAVLLFYIITIAGIFVLRIKNPDSPRPYKTPLYPVLPIIYVTLAIGVCTSLIIYKTTFALSGLIIVLCGLPVYYLYFKRSKINS